jgi:hypothetical protein
MFPYNTDGHHVENAERERASNRAYDQADRMSLAEYQPYSGVPTEELRTRFANVETEWLRQWTIDTDAKALEDVRRIKNEIRVELLRRGIVV